MKHFHKLVSFALIVGMTVSLIACGQSPEDYDFTVSYDGIAEMFPPQALRCMTRQF